MSNYGNIRCKTKEYALLALQLAHTRLEMAEEDPSQVKQAKEDLASAILYFIDTGELK